MYNTKFLLKVIWQRYFGKEPQLSKKHQVMLQALLLAITSGLLSIGLAQDVGALATDALSPVNEGFCALLDAARNELTYVFVAGAIVVGGMMRAAGNRGGMGVLTGGIIGGFIVLAGPALASAIFPGATECA